jgi:hypothetical protein
LDSRLHGNDGRGIGNNPIAPVNPASEAGARISADEIKRVYGTKERLYLGEASAKEVDDFSATVKNDLGVDLKFREFNLPVRYTIDGDGIRHAMNGHGNPATEAARGNIAITLDDIAGYRDIVRNADIRVAGYTKRGLPAVAYGKQVNGHFVVVEAARTAQGEIAFTTMWKGKGKLTRGALSSGLRQRQRLRPNSAPQGDTIPQNPAKSQEPLIKRLDKALDEEAPPFIKREIAQIKQAYTANDKNAVSAKITELMPQIDNPAIERVYRLAQEAESELSKVKAVADKYGVKEKKAKEPITASESEISEAINKKYGLSKGAKSAGGSGGGKIPPPPSAKGAQAAQGANAPKPSGGQSGNGGGGSGSAGGKDSGFYARSPISAGSSAAGFVAGGTSDEEGWNNERAIAGAIGGYAIGSRFAKRDLSKVYGKAVRSKQAFDDITGGAGTLRRLFTDTLSDSYTASREARNAAINREAVKLERLHNALKEDFTAAERKELHEYLTGDSATISPKMKAFADDIRKQIDDLGWDLVNSGILSPEAFKEWAGVYVHRSYEKHLGLKGAINNLRSIPDYLTGRLQQSATIAETFRRGKIWQGTREEFDGLTRLGAIGSVRAGKIEAKLIPGTGKYEFRRDWTKAERETMGEITDAAFSIPETLLRLQTMKQNGEFLKEVTGVKDALLLEKSGQKIADDVLDGLGYKRVPNNRKYGALAGRAVRKDVLSDINAFNDSVNKTLFGSDNPIAKAWLGYLSLWKKSKTLWNAPTHLNNFNSNMFLMHLAGMKTNEIAASLKNAAKFIYSASDYEKLMTKAATKTLTPKEQKALSDMQGRIKYYVEAKEQGIFGRSQLNDILRGHLEGFAPKNALGKMSEWTQKLYQGEDNINRLAMFSFLREKQGFNALDAKRFVNSIMPDYTKAMPAGWRFLRDGGVAPFISWSYYTLPTIFRMLKTRQGATQAAKVIGALGALEYAIGINPLDNLPFREGGKPQDFKGRRFAYNRRGAIVDTIKLDRQIPYVEMLHPMNLGLSVLSGPTTNITVALGTAASSQGAISAYSGRPISYPNRTAGGTLVDYAKYGVNQFAPLPPRNV